jgi:cell division protein FtsW (lipid II flippase)
LANRTINQLRSPLAALVLPVLAGIAWMAWAGAPTAWLAVNAGALAVSVALALWLPLPRSQAGHLVLAITAVALLGLTLLSGTEVDGVRRWLSLGPVRLHTGYLVMPLLVILASRLPVNPASYLLLGAVLTSALQPDRATSVALAAATTAIFVQRPVMPLAGPMAAALAGVFITFDQPDPLQPVRFVEQVQSDALAASPLLGALLVLVTFAPLLLLARRKHSVQPLVAFLIAAGLMALAGPYPAILIGYGAAPILGFGLALAALRAR